MAEPSILIGGVNDDGDRGLLRQLAGALLLDYDAVEGTGAVLPCRLYIKVTGSETDEEFGKGFQCCLFSLAAAARNDRSDSGSKDSGRNSYTSGRSVAAGLRRREGDAKPIKM